MENAKFAYRRKRKKPPKKDDDDGYDRRAFIPDNVVQWKEQSVPSILRWTFPMPRLALALRLLIFS